jgi:hypothetical protein
MNRSPDVITSAKSASVVVGVSTWASVVMLVDLTLIVHVPASGDRTKTFSTLFNVSYSNVLVFESATDQLLGDVSVSRSP